MDSKQTKFPSFWNGGYGSMYQPPAGFLQDDRNHSVHGNWFHMCNLKIPAPSPYKSALHSMTQQRTLLLVFGYGLSSLSTPHQTKRSSVTHPPSSFCTNLYVCQHNTQRGKELYIHMCVYFYWTEQNETMWLRRIPNKVCFLSTRRILIFSS